MDKEFIVRVKTPDIWPLEKTVLTIRLKCGDVDLACEQELVSVEPMGFARAAEFALNHLLAAEAIAPVAHGVPISKNRPQKYEMYEEVGIGENGETLYRKRIFVDKKNSVEYCPVCGKRLCSRFRSFCPSCGARMDGETE